MSGYNSVPPSAQTSVPGHPEPQRQGNLSWQGFLEKIQDKLPLIYTLLSRGEIHMEEDRVRVDLTLRSDFEKSRLKTKNTELQNLSKTFLGKPIELQLSGETRKPKETRETQKAEDRARQEASMHPLVQEARRLFDGEIIL